MKPISILSWLYDAKPVEAGISFIFLGATVHMTRFSDLESVTELRKWSIGRFSAYNFKSRIFSRTFQLALKKGWFTRSILITPANPEEFIAALRRNEVIFIQHASK